LQKFEARFDKGFFLPHALEEKEAGIVSNFHWERTMQA
jgi:hypothetical protein